MTPNPGSPLSKTLSAAGDRVFVALQGVLEHEKLGNVTVAEADHDVDVGGLLLGRQRIAGVVQNRQDFVDGFLNVLHNVGFNEVDHDIALFGVLQRVLEGRVFF